ncbi:hypothetical protein K469DRAFT_717196 [Zopfia rhizophila CBS 207.26]|uniref:Uncharacterized protein n=1 Tax=Zopfia rhizophila CBS 207.26 TaxID=1314779 RepID=A0A6A6ERT4_9PEZI|nr:hypothetical protein K469DRAFT_717196 [Zopfia rhizophila CBS 207.26]
MKEHVESAKDVLQTAVVVVSLVHTLMDSFGSASDLFQKLKRKSKKVEAEVEEVRETHRPLARRRRDDSDDDYEFRERQERSRSRRGKSRGRSAGYDSDEESIYSSGALVRQEYDRGYHHLGQQFAVGDIIAQNQLQAQIISMQQTIIKIFQESSLMNGPSANPVSHQLARLLETTRVARASSIEALALQYQRMLTAARVPEAIPPPPVSSEVVIRTKSRARDRSPDSNASTRSAPTATSSHSNPRGLFCIYALDLQKHIDQPLADNYKDGGDGRCPYCKCRLSTRPGKAWEIVKVDEKRRDRDRIFLVENRFVVKSHKESGGFACVLCSRERPSDTICDSVAALVDHVWREHTVGEYGREVDVVEIG